MANEPLRMSSEYSEIPFFKAAAPLGGGQPHMLTDCSTASGEADTQQNRIRFWAERAEVQILRRSQCAAIVHINHCLLAFSQPWPAAV